MSDDLSTKRLCLSAYVTASLAAVVRCVVDNVARCQASLDTLWDNLRKDKPVLALVRYVAANLQSDCVRRDNRDVAKFRSQLRYKRGLAGTDDANSQMEVAIHERPILPNLP